MNQSPAVIVVHPSSAIYLEPVPADPRDHPVLMRATPEEVEHAKEAAEHERQDAAKAIREDELRRVDGIEALTLLVDEFGAARVGSWLRNIAARKGETL